MTAERNLNDKQRGVIPIAAFAASGDLDQLKDALDQGLDAGLTVNEIKEILVQLYAYAGFPRSLNGIHVFMAVLEERQSQGIEDKDGREASPLPTDLDRDDYGARVRAKLAGQEEIPPASGYQLFVPVMDAFLKEHLFADIFARDVLDFQTRELATISALANMAGTEGQLQLHLFAAMNTGLSEGQLKDFISVLESRVDEKAARKAAELLTKQIDRRD